MRFSIYIAKHYLLSKKTKNVVNIISTVAMVGVMVGTSAMVIVLSIFNGIDSLITNLYSVFDPHLKITSVEGKQFDPNSDSFRAIQNDTDVVYYCDVLEEIALFHYEERQFVAKIKGVTPDYLEMTNMDSVLYTGKSILSDGNFDYTIMGIGVSSALGAASNFIRPVSISVPKKGKNNLFSIPFNQDKLFLSGVYSTGDVEEDDAYAYVPIHVARKLTNSPKAVTSIDLKFKPEIEIKSKQKQFQQLLGDGFELKNQKQLHAEYFKVSSIERFFIYIILSLILIIASFNLTGAITMLILDKKQDIHILSSFGLVRRKIAEIFFIEGFLITLIGAIVGIVLGVLICYGQIYFEWLKFPGNFTVQAYPVVVKFSNLLLIFFTVLGIGSLLSLLPVKLLPKRFFEISKE